MAGRGGKRTGAGRPRTKPEVPEIDRGFATRVLARIGKKGWDKITRKNATNAEEYMLALLCCGDQGVEERNFNRLLDRKYGKPPQSVIHADTRESVPEVEFGNLPMPAGPKPGTTGKPN